MERSVVIYLDWNIISAFVGGEKSDLLSLLQEAIEKEKVVVPYSYAHVLEIANITGSSNRSKEDIIEEKLNFLSSFTSDIHLKVEDDEQQAHLERMSVRIIYLGAKIIKPILEMPFPQDEKPDLSEMRARRLEYGLDPSKLNNIPPDQIIASIDKILTSEENQNQFPDNDIIGKTIKQLYEESTRKANDVFSSLGTMPSLGANITVIYTFLDAFGYWPEKEKKNVARSQFIDANHNATAIYADAYVTDDFKHKMKTLAAYSYFGIQTPVISSDELASWLKGST